MLSTFTFVSCIGSLKANTVLAITNTFVYRRYQVKICVVNYHWRSEMDVVIEAESSPIGDAGGGADADVHDTVLKWLRRWWWSCFIPAWQVAERWAMVIHCVVVSLFELVENPQWLAAVTDWSLGPSSVEETDWTWVHSTDFRHVYNTMFEKLCAASVTNQLDLFSCLVCGQGHSQEFTSGGPQKPRENRGAEGGGELGRSCPLPNRLLTRSLGEHHELSSGVWGWSPGRQR